MIRTQEERSFAHYGTPRHSGRYPWGSGGDPANTRNRSIIDARDALKDKGMTDKEIYEGWGMTSTQYRAEVSIAAAEARQAKISQATRLREKGWSYQKIAERMGLPGESSARSLCRPGEIDKASATHTTANTLKKQVAEKTMVDVGAGVEAMMAISKTRLSNAVAILKAQGYGLHEIFIPQVTQPGKFTTMKVLTKPGITKDYVNKNRKDIRQIDEHSIDHGRSFLGIQTPIKVNPRRLAVNYKEDGGAQADGVIYVRPGVKDLSIGSNRYGQVRIQVGDTHFLKGMAVYKDDLPAGKDLVFNTSKTKKQGWKSDSNKLSDDPNNPFGSIIRQVSDPTTGKVSSAMNIVGTKDTAGVEGAWDTWSRNLPSQMLSKQSPKLAQQQLELTFDRRQREYDEIRSLTNPTVRKDLLEKFAAETDAAAAHLRAANLPRQATKVLMPIPSMKPTEVYAPTMRDGERVVLIRFPHGGKFEIPELTVNNRNKEARKLLGTSSPGGKHDAVGVHQEVAHRLSGADFDGDTVLIIPNNKGSVKWTPALEELKGFDPQTYKLPKDSPIPRMDSATKGKEMGKVSNLITDMSIGGANNSELARAVKHSMVVIDAEKHGLDYKLSEKDNGIRALKEKYQGGPTKGASTLLSRAGAELHVPHRELRKPGQGGPIDPVTGKLVYVPTGKQKEKTVLKKDPRTGKKQYVVVGTEDVTIKTKKLREAEDARDLISTKETAMEILYATHSNRLKAMANLARKESLPIKANPRDPQAAKVYHKEVDSINAKVNLAEKNAPYERQAQLLAGMAVSQTKQSNPGMDKDDVKKVKHLALAEYRIRTGAGKDKIVLTQSEWDAIQAGAVSKDKLERILKNGDIDTVRKLAMPKNVPKMSSAKMARATAMLASGFTQAEVADALGVGLTTLKVAISE